MNRLRDLINEKDETIGDLTNRVKDLEKVTKGHTELINTNSDTIRDHKVGYSLFTLLGKNQSS